MGGFEGQICVCFEILHLDFLSVLICCAEYRIWKSNDSLFSFVKVCLDCKCFDYVSSFIPGMHSAPKFQFREVKVKGDVLIRQKNSPDLPVCEFCFREPIRLRES